jgi:uncharacterized integral membrane protein (TIGR00698 family)
MGLGKMMEEPYHLENKIKIDYEGYAIGLLLTFGLAWLAGRIAQLPFFSIMGIMIISILLGALWSNTKALPIPANATLGITFSSRKLLRAGIVFLGFRLNLTDIMNAGISVLAIDMIVIAFTMVFILILGKVLKVNSNLTTLIAAGTAICGAAAIVAVSPMLKSKQEQTAIAVSCIAILGTIGALLLIFLYPYLPLTDTEYGVLAGATLHELAHVVAASVPGGAEGGDAAILVKLGRVMLLIPVIIIISLVINRKDKSRKNTLKNLPFPWFILCFLLMSIINTIAAIPQSVISFLLTTSTYLLAMGMVGLGLTIRWKDFKKVGFKPIILAAMGFLGLLLVSPLLVLLFRFL